MHEAREIAHVFVAARDLLPRLEDDLAAGVEAREILVKELLLPAEALVARGVELFDRARESLERAGEKAPDERVDLASNGLARGRGGFERS